MMLLMWAAQSEATIASRSATPVSMTDSAQRGDQQGEYHL